jgi:Fe-S cluster assembly ATP-binding protein
MVFCTNKKKINWKRNIMPNLLEIRNLSVYVEGQELLHQVNLVIPASEVHALLGPNGSGKTSLMMAVMGFSDYQVVEGQILFDGQDITDLDVTERARLGISVAQQRPPTIAGVKLRDVLTYTMAGDLACLHEFEQVIHEAHMERFLDRDINGSLSGGEIKRSELLQLLATQPKLAMMDEPDSGVDLETLPMVGNLVNRLFTVDATCPTRRNAGLVITHTGHILNYVETDKAHIMMGGTVACSGNPHLVLDTVSQHGYEECVRCIQAGL